jgi:hypothetical protein
MKNSNNFDLFPGLQPNRITMICLTNLSGLLCRSDQSEKGGKKRTMIITSDMVVVRPGAGLKPAFVNNFRQRRRRSTAMTIILKCPHIGVSTYEFYPRSSFGTEDRMDRTVEFVTSE